MRETSTLAVCLLALGCSGAGEIGGGVDAAPTSDAARAWPNEPAGFAPLNDQPWDSLTGNGWSWLRRTASKDPDIVTDSTAPASPENILRMIYTTDMAPDSEPSVHWIGLSGGIREIYTAWWMKVSANWVCSPAGCGKITFLFTEGGLGQVYTSIYHPCTWPDTCNPEVYAPPYRVGANTEWAPYGQRVWYPNVTTTWLDPDEWHRIEFYYRWETSPGVSGDGIIRWWVDGVLDGDHTDVHYPDALSFSEFQYGATTQNVPPAEQYMYMDHTRVSARK